MTPIQKKDSADFYWETAAACATSFINGTLVAALSHPYKAIEHSPFTLKGIQDITQAKFNWKLGLCVGGILATAVCIDALVAHLITQHSKRDSTDAESLPIFLEKDGFIEPSDSLIQQAPWARIASKICVFGAMIFAVYSFTKSSSKVFLITCGSLLDSALAMTNVTRVATFTMSSHIYPGFELRYLQSTIMLPIVQLITPQSDSSTYRYKNKEIALTPAEAERYPIFVKNIDLKKVEKLMETDVSSTWRKAIVYACWVLYYASRSYLAKNPIADGNGVIFNIPSLSTYLALAFAPSVFLLGNAQRAQNPFGGLSTTEKANALARLQLSHNLQTLAIVKVGNRYYVTDKKNAAIEQVDENNDDELLEE